MLVIPVFCLLFGPLISESSPFVGQPAESSSSNVSKVFTATSNDRSSSGALHWSRSWIPELTLKAWHGRRLKVHTLLSIKSRFKQSTWGVLLALTWGAADPGQLQAQAIEDLSTPRGASK